MVGIIDFSVQPPWTTDISVRSKNCHKRESWNGCVLGSVIGWTECTRTSRDMGGPPNVCPKKFSGGTQGDESWSDRCVTNPKRCQCSCAIDDGDIQPASHIWKFLELYFCDVIFRPIHLMTARSDGPRNACGELSKPLRRLIVNDRAILDLRYYGAY